MEKPILFTTGMVRAIMDGRKTQTRRICKPWHEHISFPDFEPMVKSIKHIK